MKAVMNLKKIYCEVFCQVIDQSDSRKSMDRQRKELIAKSKSKASDAFSGKTQ